MPPEPNSTEQGRSAPGATEQKVTQQAKARSYRILMIAPTSFFADYGCHVRIYEEANILQKLGHKVTIVTYRNGNDVPGLDIRRTLPIPWRAHYEVGASRHMLAFDALLGMKTFELLMRQRYDVIHAHLHEGALIGLLLGQLVNTPVVFDFQGSATEESIDRNFIQRGSFFHKTLYQAERWINQHASVILPSSANAERGLLDDFQCQPGRIRILPDCVNADMFRPASEFDPSALATLRQQLGIPADAKIIVYVGLLAEYQGTGLLLAAMQRILAQHNNVYLLLMGFPHVGYYQQQATTLGIGDSVIFTGRIPYQNLATYLALGDVAVAPKLSMTEGCGKLLNYMAMALPTVAFDTPVAREYLGLDGLLAARGSTESLAAHMAAALLPPDDAPNAYRDMGLRLRQRAIQHFDWHVAGQQIVKTYRELLGDIAAPDVAQRLAVEK